MPSWQSIAIGCMLRITRWKRDKKRPLEQFRPDVEATLARLPKRRDVYFESLKIGGIPAEWAVPEHITSKHVILYLHGGAFILGSIRAYRSLVSYLAHLTGARILTIDYRLAPEHPFPAAVEDTVSAYRWLLTQDYAPEQLVVAGDSSGGGLALALLICAREQGLPMPAASIGLSPGLNSAISGRSMNLKKDLVLYPEMIDYIKQAYLVDADPQNPLVSPLNADLCGFPPLFIQVGSRELLFDDACLFVERAHKAGVHARLDIWKNMFHGWQLFAAVLPEGNQALKNVSTFLLSLS